MSQFLERLITATTPPYVPPARDLDTAKIENSPDYCPATYYLEHGHMPDGNEEYTGPKVKI